MLRGIGAEFEPENARSFELSEPVLSGDADIAVSVRQLCGRRRSEGGTRRRSFAPAIGGEKDSNSRESCELGLPWRTSASRSFRRTDPDNSSAGTSVVEHDVVRACPFWLPGESFRNRVRVVAFDEQALFVVDVDAQDRFQVAATVDEFDAEFLEL